MEIALIGLGGMGLTHYMNYLRIPGAHVAACVGQGESDRQRAESWGVPLYATVTEACARHPIDLVDCCAPTWLHAPLAAEALRLGRHTLVEKPLTLSAAQARELYAVAERTGAQLYVAQVVQFLKETEILRAYVTERPFGKPLDGCFERLSACPQWIQGQWLFDREKSGLLPYDLHIHDLDLIVSLFGRPDEVSCTCTGRDDKPYYEQYRFRYTYHGGPTVSAEAAWFSAQIPFTARWRVYFEHGMLVCDQNGLIAYGEDGAVRTYDTAEPILVDAGANLPANGWFYKELSHFLRCAAENRPSEHAPKQRILDVLDVLETVAAKA